MNNWTTTVPTEVGDYFFYGDVRGGMGSHWREPFDPFTPELMMVSVRKSGTGSLMFVGNGRFLPDRKFDITDKRRHEGFVGYWKRNDVDLPEDFENVFCLTI